MGNLDFLEKKPRIAYTLSWDGVTEGKVTNTSGTSAKLAYKISDEIFIADPIIDDVNSVSTLKVPKNIDIVDAFYAKAFGSDSKGTCLVYPVVNDAEFAGKNGAYQFDLYFKDEESDSGYATSPIELYYILVANKEIPAPFGNVNPKFPEKGWYIYVPSSITYTGDLMSVLKDPLVQFSYSGKGFTSPQKPYSYISRSVEPDDDICVWINEARIPELIDEEFVKGYNAFCNPGDFDSIAEIKLDENLANICKHAARQCLAIRTKNRGGTDYYYYNMEVGASSDDTFIYYNVSYATKGPDNNKVSGLCIELGGSLVYFNPNVTIDEYDEWHDKYIATEP